MSFQCEFCTKCFSTKYSLNSHKLKTKYCLEIQKTKGVSVDLRGSEKCDYCDKYFLLKDSRCDHEIICKKKSTVEYSIVNDLNLEIERLKSELKFANEKAMIYKTQSDEKDAMIMKLSIEKSVVNTNYNNTTSTSTSNRQNIIIGPLDLSLEKIKSAVENYTIDHYNRTSEGMVDWCVNNLLKDENNNLRYICNDKNRRCFQFKSESGDIITDPNADKLKASVR